MPSVDVNRRKGNFAQAVASAWLSRVCLVRPVAEGTDIGIDLYCESFVNGAPSLHFWVQVKSISANAIEATGGTKTAKYRFQTKHLNYWQQQPIPVYSLLVPVNEWPPEEPSTIYGVRISSELNKSELPTGDSHTLRSTDTFDRDTLDLGLGHFVRNVVPADTSVLLANRGIVTPLPAETSSAQSDVVLPYLDALLVSIRSAAEQGLSLVLGTDFGVAEFGVRRKRYEALVSAFEGDIGHFGLIQLARSAAIESRNDQAIRYFELAVERVREDSSLDVEFQSRMLQGISEAIAELQA